MNFGTKSAFSEGSESTLSKGLGPGPSPLYKVCLCSFRMPLFLSKLILYHIISYHIICIFPSYSLHILQKYTNILYKYFSDFKIRFILVFETRKDSQKATVALSSSPFSSTGFCELTGEIY